MRHKTYLMISLLLASPAANAQMALKTLPSCGDAALFKAVQLADREKSLFNDQEKSVKANADTAAGLPEEAKRDFCKQLKDQQKQLQSQADDAALSLNTASGSIGGMDYKACASEMTNSAREIGQKMQALRGKIDGACQQGGGGR